MMNKNNRESGGGEVREAHTLRAYQTEAIDAVRDHFRAGNRSALVVMATGCGKTFTALTAVASTIENGKRVLWLAHRRELLLQTAQAWALGWPGLAPAGILQAENDENAAALVCASVGTVGRRSDEADSRLRQYLSHGLPSLIVVDEAHHSAAGQWRGILDVIGKEATKAGHTVYRMGLTATPERTDSASLVELWGALPAYCYDYGRAIDEDYLVAPVYVVSQMTMDDETRAALAAAREAFAADEFRDDRAELAAWAKIAIEGGLIEHTVSAMGKNIIGRKSIVFAATVAQAEATALALRAVGWSAFVISANTPRKDRASLLARFAAGEIDAICNCTVLTEGTDLPRCDGIVAARPFSSRPLWVQAVGRGLRLHPEKSDCIVLDLVGASEEHDEVYAAVLIDQIEGEDTDQRSSGGGSMPWDPTKGRHRVEASWVRIGATERDGWVVDCGHVGIVVLRTAGDVWSLMLIGRRSNGHYIDPVELYTGSMLDRARRTADDVFRRSGTVSSKSASWRGKRPSERQVELAIRRRIVLSPTCTRGEATDAIAKDTALTLIRRFSL